MIDQTKSHEFYRDGSFHVNERNGFIMCVRRHVRFVGSAESAGFPCNLDSLKCSG